MNALPAIRYVFGNMPEEYAPTPLLHTCAHAQNNIMVTAFFLITRLEGYGERVVLQVGDY